MTPQFQYLVAEDISSPFFTIPDCFYSHPSSLSSNSTSEEADEQQTNVICERKRRRMISNRESARRSRIRKQNQLGELFAQLDRLRTDNQSLIEQLNHLAESHERAVGENARLKEESTDIRQKLDEIHLANSSSLSSKLNELLYD